MAKSNWIVAATPVVKVAYDVRNPPSSDVIATRNYLGPDLSVCGNPDLVLLAAGNQLSFLSFSFD